MIVTEEFQAAWDQTLAWLKGSDRQAWDGYEVGQLLQRVGLKYNWRLLTQTDGTGEREWREIQMAWARKLSDLGAPESLLATVRAVE
ncbi:hypothetical protein ABMY26_27685 [Azospirillum sp. HJ39]|uniref:hypothetical protein n=1 Tax=Azospirillum sp. HJ39 TaxID=3159496 RepID=UPI003558366D